MSFDSFSLAESDLDSRFEIGAIVGRPQATLREIIEHLRSSYCGTITAQFAEAMPAVRNWFIERFEREGVAVQPEQPTAEEKREILEQLARTDRSKNSCTRGTSEKSDSPSKAATP